MKGLQSCGPDIIPKVSFKDLLDRKYAPPLSLRDFEEYLLHVEYAPENLSFYLWLRKYDSLYKQWEAETGDVRGLNLPEKLSETFNKALAQYFDGGPLELNISAQAQLELAKSIQDSSNPAIFKPVISEVTEMLEQSKSRWLAMYSSTMITKRKTSSIIIGIGLALIFLSVHLAIFFFSPWKLARVVAMPLLWAAMIIILNSVQRIYLSNYVFKKTTIARPFEGWFAALKTERKKLKLFKTQKNSAKNHILMELPIVQRVIEKKPIVNINTSLISNSNSTALVIESEEEAKYFRTKLPSVPSRALKKSDWQEPTTWSPSELEVRALNQKLCLESSIKPKYTLEPSYRWIFLKSTIFTIFFSIFWLLIWIPLPPPFH